jgi:hypothetical protein
MTCRVSITDLRMMIIMILWVEMMEVYLSYLHPGISFCHLQVKLYRPLAVGGHCHHILYTHQVCPILAVQIVQFTCHKHHREMIALFHGVSVGLMALPLVSFLHLGNICQYLLPDTQLDGFLYLSGLLIHRDIGGWAMMVLHWGNETMIVFLYMRWSIVIWITFDDGILIFLGNLQLSSHKLLLEQTLQGIWEGLDSLSLTQTMFTEIGLL